MIDRVNGLSSDWDRGMDDLFDPVRGSSNIVEVFSISDEQVIEAARRSVLEFWQPIVPNLGLEQLELDTSYLTDKSSILFALNGEFQNAWSPIRFRAGNHLYLVHLKGTDLYDLDVKTERFKVRMPAPPFLFETVRMPDPAFVIPIAKEALFQSLERDPELFPGLTRNQMIGDDVKDVVPIFLMDTPDYFGCAIHFEVMGVQGAFYTVNAYEGYLKVPNALHNKLERIALPDLG